ncbi:YitT family protein [Enterococcus sp. LJL120]
MKIQQREFIKKILVIILCGLTGGLALNFFLIPGHILSAGMNGVAQIITSVLWQNFQIHVSTGLFIFLLNVPLFILGFVKLGKENVIYSFANVISVSLFTMIIPLGEITDNIMMNGIVGGVLLGIGAGYSLKMGFTSGGMDILSLVLSKTTGKTVGKYMFLLNGVIVLMAGLIFDWESALYTIISIFCMSQVVDVIHTSHQKLTVMIVTQKADEVADKISRQLFRGMTLFPSKGGFSKADSTTIMMVITRYELYQLEQILTAVDEGAFVNVMPTQAVLGQFANEDEQKYFQTTGNFPNLKKHNSKR